MSFQTLNGHQLYRIGDCLISVNAENPSKNFGGKWELLCPGRTLVCVDTSQSEFNTVKKTGGAKTHVLTTAQIPSHTHTQNAHNHSASSGSAGAHGHNAKYAHVHASGMSLSTTSPYFDLIRKNVSGDTSHGSASVALSAGSHSHSVSIGNATPIIHATGGSEAHNNLQPFMAVYIWVRVG
ncbi:MAG: hypothetical protein K2P09_02865 [Erysipelotrichales bacterium]|nr:hypothetical protein [Erysipelotrichales bacterium]